MNLLTQKDYPGNIRELAQMVENAVLLAEGPVILPVHLGGNGVPEMLSRRCPAAVFAHSKKMIRPM